MGKEKKEEKRKKTMVNGKKKKVITSTHLYPLILHVNAKQMYEVTPHRKMINDQG